MLRELEKKGVEEDEEVQMKSRQVYWGWLETWSLSCVLKIQTGTELWQYDKNIAITYIYIQMFWLCFLQKDFCKFPEHSGRNMSSLKTF